jgi:hypothetical protein
MRVKSETAISDWLRSNVLGLVAIFIALSGTAYAVDGPLPGQNQVGSDDIINGEVKTGDVGDFEIKAADIAPDSLGGGKIANQSVKNADLSIGASSSNTIADGGIQGIDVQNGTLTIPKLSFDPATQPELNNLATDDGDGPNAGSNLVSWNRLGGVPAGFADGVDDGATNAWSLAGNSGTTSSDFLGTTDNQPLNLRVNDARGLRIEPASDGTNQSPNLIGGIADNSVTAGVHSATIGGGGRSVAGSPATANEVTDDEGTVSGGANNQAGDGAGTPSDRRAATVAGGIGNTASGSQATVSGGSANTASADGATVGGGADNDATGATATVAGGFVNNASGNFATVPGGVQNVAQGAFSLAGGRRAQANHQGAFVWADSSFFDFASTAQDQFNVRSTGGARLVSGIDGSGNPTSGLELPAGTSGWSTLVNGQPFDVRVNGARALRLEPASDGTNQSPNVIGGSADNSVIAGVHSATIGGGGRSNPASATTANRVTDNRGTVGGGANNQAGNNAGTVSDRSFATVGGGESNTASGSDATVGGGLGNTASGTTATVGGGDSNTADFNSATVGGGDTNTASGGQAVVSGGFNNAATDLNDTVGGGASNTVSGSAATVGGGLGNTASGVDATVPGGTLNTALGSFSFAAGRRALADHQGAFVWADSSNFNFHSTANNQFTARATGGVRFISAIDPLDGGSTAGVTLAPGGGSWSSLSDAASKRAVEPVSGRDVLDRLGSVPISTWSYRSQGRGVRHIGPMAQDFYRAFAVGEDERHITSIDADGVALAAIKGLERELRAERRHRVEQERRTARLEARLARLERAR